MLKLVGTLTRSCSFGSLDDTASKQPLCDRNFLDDQKITASGKSGWYMSCEVTTPTKLEYSGPNENHGRCHSLDVHSDVKECSVHSGDHALGFHRLQSHPVSFQEKTPMTVKSMLKHPFAAVQMKMRESRSHKIHYEPIHDMSNKRLTLTRSCSVDGLDQQLTEDSSMWRSEWIDDSPQVNQVIPDNPQHKPNEVKQPATQRQYMMSVSTVEKKDDDDLEVKHATLKRSHSMDAPRDPHMAEQLLSLVQSDTHVHGKSIMKSKKSLNSASSILNEDKKDSELKRSLFKPKSPQQLIDVLESGKVDVNKLDDKSGLAPIHKIVVKKRKERADILLALLTHSNADVNLQSRRRDTALHLAVEQGDEICVKVLISFGADVNQPGSNEFTPLDLAINHGKVPKIEDALLELGARSSVVQLSRMLPENQQPSHEKESETVRNQRLLEELQHNLNRCMSLSKSFGGADEAVAIYYQQKEIAQYNKTLYRLSIASLPNINKGGKRLLFLDGGGIKGLVEIEILMHIEERTGKRITELFDWIVGTSTGGIIALALVYAKKSLQELRQLFFKLKDKVFANARLGFAYSSKVLESLLKDALGEMRMDEVSTPKVMISAVNKSTTLLELHFFSNCLGDEYSTAPVWKVARYTSAAPMFFTESDNYVDGGVLINNPCEAGLTTIQNYYRKQKQKVTISVVASVGTGVYPPEKLGKVDAQKFLFFGTHWFNMPSLMKRAQNLMLLLSNALVESEMVASNCESRCKEQSIPYFRFSPKLDDVIAAGETDTEKLVNMIMQAKIQSKDRRFEDLIGLLLEA